MPEARGSRFFHALVVVGAAVSATACGGRSENQPDGEATGGGAGDVGGSGTAAGSSNASGAGGGGTAGTGGRGPFPEPTLPTAQWDCRDSFSGCVDALGVTAHQLTGSCRVNESGPTSAADCPSGGILTCALAVTVSGEPVLVNCECWPGGESACGGCSSLNGRNGTPVSCTPELKICECAYTGILR